LADQSNPSFAAILRSLWDGVVKVVRFRFLFLLGGLGVFVAIGRAQLGWAADNPVLLEALDALSAILILPVDIAIYRLLILDDASANSWASSAPRMQRMVGWAIVMWILVTIPSYLTNLTPSVAANTVATIVVTVIVVVLMVRLAILLPAIAVDAPGASLANVWADTGGRFWLILKTYLIAILPVLALVVVDGMITDRIGVSDRLGNLGDSTLEFLVTLMFVVASARLFDWAGHQVKGLPASPAQLAGQTPPAG
jgi:hypothetical protein